MNTDKTGKSDLSGSGILRPEYRRFARPCPPLSPMTVSPATRTMPPTPRLPTSDGVYLHMNTLDMVRVGLSHCVHISYYLPHLVCIYPICLICPTLSPWGADMSYYSTKAPFRGPLYYRVLDVLDSYYLVALARILPGLCLCDTGCDQCRDCRACVNYVVRPVIATLFRNRTLHLFHPLCSCSCLHKKNTTV